MKLGEIVQKNLAWLFNGDAVLNELDEGPRGGGISRALPAQLNQPVAGPYGWESRTRNRHSYTYAALSAPHTSVTLLWGGGSCLVAICACLRARFPLWRCSVRVASSYMAP